MKVFSGVLVYILFTFIDFSFTLDSKSYDIHCGALLTQRDNSSVAIGALSNDNFCDCILSQGTIDVEESLTSACSFYTVGKRVFHCKQDIGTEPKMIFGSQLSDGICDCCDGSDEDSAQNGGVECADMCEKNSVQAKRSALLWHRTVQAGKNKRQDLLNALEMKRRKELDAYSDLEEQIKELKMLHLKLRIYLDAETPRENKERFRLLRERLANCVMGISERCEFFHIGFFDEDELMDYEIPDKLKHMRKPRVAVVHTVAELAYMKELTGTARVRSSLCEAVHILRDDTHKICTSTGELVAFLDSPYGKHATTKIKPHETTLFGRFLDEGEYGYMMGALAIGEFLSFLMLPVTGVMYSVSLCLDYGREKMWETVAACNISTNSTIPQLVQRACIGVVNAHTPGTMESSVLQYLDPSSFSVTSRLYDRLEPLTIWPYRIARLFWYAPQLYYQYYLTDASNAVPPRRMCCLLRAGIDSARREISSFVARLQDENAAREAIKAADAIATEQGSKLVDDRSKSKRSRDNGKNEPAFEMIDYGLRKEWEAVKTTCLEKRLGLYDYKFCFFKEITQGDTLLGRFSSWGTRQADTEAQETPKAKMKSKHRKKPAGKKSIMESAWVSDGLDTLGLKGRASGGDSAGKEVSRNDSYYTSQVRIRPALILFIATYSLTHPFIRSFNIRASPAISIHLHTVEGLRRRCPLCRTQEA